jgi:hypothetical protein
VEVPCLVIVFAVAEAKDATPPLHSNILGLPLTNNITVVSSATSQNVV